MASVEWPSLGQDEATTKYNSIARLVPPQPEFRNHPSLLPIFFQPQSKISPDRFVTKPARREIQLHAAFPQRELDTINTGFLSRIVTGRGVRNDVLLGKR